MTLSEKQEGGTAVQEKATDLLRMDHRAVQDLFAHFDSARSPGEKQDIVRTACRELRVHTALEEEVFYPHLQQKGGAEMAGLVDQALEEHHVARMLIEELERMTPSAVRYDAKFKVLASSVKQHIHMEEFDIFPEAGALGADELSPRLLARRGELEESLAGAEETDVGG